MASNKNNGLFDKIKKSIDHESNSTATLEAFTDLASEELGLASQELVASVEQRLLKRFTKEKQQLVEELAAKYKDENHKRGQQQAQKFKLLLQEELAVKHKELKLQYEQAVKVFLQKREKELTDKFKEQLADLQQTYHTDAADQIANLQQQLAQKQQALEQNKQQTQCGIAEAKIIARKEQEAASREMYENLMQANHAEIVAKIEKKHLAQLEQREQVLLLEQTDTYASKLQQALTTQKLQLTAEHDQELAKQKEIFSTTINAEIANVVTLTAKELRAEFEIERQTLQETITKLNPAIEANKQLLRMEVEANLRAEFELKHNEYKLTLDKSKQLELDAAVAIEKQKIAETMQEENAIILRYKEREIRQSCDQRAMQAQQTILKDALAQQEKTLMEAQQQQLDQVVHKLQTEHADELQFLLVQERMRLVEQNTLENKILLQQQQQILQAQFDGEKNVLTAQFDTEKNIFLQQQQSIIRAQYDNDKDGLLEQQKIILEKQFSSETKALLQTIAEQQATWQQKEVALIAEHNLKLSQQQQKLVTEHQLELQSLQDKLQQQMLWQNNSETDTISSKHIDILHKREQELRLQFADELAQAKQVWELQRQNLLTEHAKQVEQCEATLQNKFMTVLNSQKENQQQLDDGNQALKASFTAQMQQQKQDAELELQLIKKQLMEQQQKQIGTAVAQHTTQMREQYQEELAIIAEEQEEKISSLLEQERKKNNLQLMQDKANIVKDLTARFTREKEIAMEQYETELRDKLYKEMVKQKDYIQQKFYSTQEAALREQKRRLEAEHRHEVERIKQGYFKPEMKHPAHEQIVIGRNVEQLADRILAKFKSQDN